MTASDIAEGAMLGLEEYAGAVTFYSDGTDGDRRFILACRDLGGQHYRVTVERLDEAEVTT